MTLMPEIILTIGEVECPIINTEEIDIDVLKLQCQELANTLLGNQVRLYVDGVEVLYLIIR